MDKNEVYVTTDINDASLWGDRITLESVHWIDGKPSEGNYAIRIRHRAKLENAVLAYEDSGVTLTLADEQRAIAPGQSVVIYDGDTVLGGGIITLAA